MEHYQTWRDLLAMLIAEPREGERLAKALGVDVLTLRRWANNEANPHLSHVHRLLQVVPQHQMLLRALLAEEFDDVGSAYDASPAEGVPVAFFTHILDIYTSASPESRCWSICTAVLSEALKHLDPQHTGISLSVVQCMAAEQEKDIRYLHEYISLGSSPWLEQVQCHTRFLGAESLAGAAVSSGLPQIVADNRQGQRSLNALPKYAASAAAFPLLHSGHTAGCLLAASTQPDYFSSSPRCDLIQNYADLLILAFSPENFSARERIALAIMPSLQVQQPYLATFQQRILATLKTAFRVHHSLSYLEAQQRVWGQIAEELVQLQSS